VWQLQLLPLLQRLRQPLMKTVSGRRGHHRMYRYGGVAAFAARASGCNREAGCCASSRWGDGLRWTSSYECSRSCAMSVCFVVRLGLLYACAYARTCIVHV